MDEPPAVVRLSPDDVEDALAADVPLSGWGAEVEANPEAGRLKSACIVCIVRLGIITDSFNLVSSGHFPEQRSYAKTFVIL